MVDTSTLSSTGSSLLNALYNLFGQDNVNVTSAGRTAATNASIAGSSGTSQHLTGDAIDFTVKGYTNQQVQAKIANAGLTYGQLIDETNAPGGSHVHIGVGSGNENEVYQNGGYAPVLSSVLKNVTMPDPSGSSAPSSVVGEALNAAGGAVSTILHPLSAAENGVIGWFEDHAIMLLVGLVGLTVVIFGAWRIIQAPADTATGVGASTLKHLAEVAA